MSLNMYLVDGCGGVAGAHLRYQQPGHYTHREAQLISYNVQTKEPVGEKWRRAYDDITAKFPPILRKFFLERYQTAAHWYVPSSVSSSAPVAVPVTVFCACGVVKTKSAGPAGVHSTPSGGIRRGRTEKIKVLWVLLHS
jgi:hypothetical protein